MPLHHFLLILSLWEHSMPDVMESFLHNLQEVINLYPRETSASLDCMHDLKLVVGIPVVVVVVVVVVVIVVSLILLVCVLCIEIFVSNVH